MDQQFSGFGAPDAHPAPDTTLAPGEEVKAGDGRALRAILAGAAAITVLGGGALGFFWLSTPPTVETVTGGTAGTRIVPPVAQSTGTPTAEGLGWSVSKRDVFKPLATPAAVTSSTSPTSSGAGPLAPVPGILLPTLAPQPTSPAPVDPDPAKTAKPAPTGTQAPAPKPSTPGAPIPVPSKSTAPAWEVSSYTYLGPRDEEDGEGGDRSNFTVAPHEVDDGYAKNLGYYVYIAPGDRLYPAAVTFQEEKDGSAWITSDRGVAQGWIVPAKKKVPATAMGKTSGTVRLVGKRNEKAYYVQVDRGPSKLYELTQKIEGTPLTLESVGTALDTVRFTDADGVTYYGPVGAGETDGVTF
ncbi:hypothetical protein CLV92_105104 [Kineococcus xinjiangensis]|uniref:Uncharacterized protein n=1 Tax=Kineococcus xinjiangensis TaxID=512762 RepID=A0A2S6IP15_9ACTN|nr:hypothetical protein [Kineococcus xinjiangensis]PPK96004.1 hypothetical protein CLV92_105104 [Kineococcus xinjiangensis]